jgi:hypothetical protein
MAPFVKRFDVSVGLSAVVKKAAPYRRILAALARDVVI